MDYFLKIISYPEPKIDANGILNVQATDRGTGKSESITITNNDKTKLTEAQIEQMIRDAEENAEADKLVKERLDSRRAFDTYLHSLSNSVNGGLGDKMSEEDKERIQEALVDAKSWLSSEGDDVSAEDIRDKQREIEEICAPVIGRYYGGSGGGGRGMGGDEDEEDEDDGEL